MAIKFNNVSCLDKIKNITYTFEDNKITTLIGSSGSGKTLLSYLMTGLILPDGGNILVEDVIIDKNTKDLKNIRKNIGYVFQNPEEQFFTNTVKEELEFSLKKYKLEEKNEIILNTLNMVCLDESFLSRNPFSLSGGEKEKLAIAIALLLNPKILILDEPTIYLDDKSNGELIGLLNKLKKKYNKTIIVISNDINFISRTADNIVMLKDGRINLNISKNEILDNMDKIKKIGLEVPKILDFISMVEKNKKIKLTYTDDLDKLVSEIRKNV